MLDDGERAMLAGEGGEAKRFAMRLVVKAAEIMGAPRLIPISFAHLDACFYTGRAHVDFIRHILNMGAKLSVPTWTTSSGCSSPPRQRSSACQIDTNGDEDDCAPVCFVWPLPEEWYCKQC